MPLRSVPQVRLTETRVEFEDAYTFPRDTLTAYRSRSGVGDFYSLETLLVWLRYGVTTDPGTGAVQQACQSTASCTGSCCSTPFPCLQRYRVTKLRTAGCLAC